MSKLQHGTPDELEAIRLKSLSYFAPILLQGALLRIRRSGNSQSLELFEKSLLDTIDNSESKDPDFEDMKEFAVELLHVCLREVISNSDMTSTTENTEDRRALGRSEKTETLEDQLQEGLEGSFPASDPPAVVSTAISGRAKKLVGTDEVLAQQKKQ